MRIDLIIFDMDGVLVDACEWHRIALNEALLEECEVEISLEDHISTFNGIPTREKLKILVDRGLISPDSVDRVERSKQAKTISIIERYAKLRQEKIDLLNNLKSKRIKIACYTNSVRLTAELMLKKTGVLELLDLLVTNQDVEKPKPDPGGYLKCMRSLGVDIANCVIVEDSPKGIQAAIQSGAKVVTVNNADDVDLNLLERLFA